MDTEELPERVLDNEKLHEKTKQIADDLISVARDAYYTWYINNCILVASSPSNLNQIN